MSRSQRLLDLIQLLRRHRRPVSGRRLADVLRVSIRTLYRDIVTLQAQGAPIEGEPGLGYVLKPGFMLPPLMFSEDEIEALVLGSRWVSDRADGRLALAARDALAKILAVLPGDLRDDAEASALLVGPGAAIMAESFDLSAIRKAIRSERKLSILYRDGAGQGEREGRLAVRLELFRPCPRRRRLVRTAAGFPAFPHRPHLAGSAARYPLSAPAPGLAEGVARAGGSSAAIVSDTAGNWQHLHLGSPHRPTGDTTDAERQFRHPLRRQPDC